MFHSDVQNFHQATLRICNPGLSPYKRRDIDCLEKVQRRSTKLVKGLKNCSSYEVRLTKLGLTTLEERRRRGDLIEAYIQDYHRQREECRISSTFIIPATTCEDTVTS